MQRFHGRHFFSWGPNYMPRIHFLHVLCDLSPTNSNRFKSSNNPDGDRGSVPRDLSCAPTLTGSWSLYVKQGLQQEETRRYLFTLLLLILSLSNAI